MTSVRVIKPIVKLVAHEELTGHTWGSLQDVVRFSPSQFLEGGAGSISIDLFEVGSKIARSLQNLWSRFGGDLIRNSRTLEALCISITRNHFSFVGTKLYMIMSARRGHLQCHQVKGSGLDLEMPRHRTRTRIIATWRHS